ncbi:uncharacterized protein EV420DRAFT_1267286 [Desarmillaria tabescens]|uniref:YCII-related domain-containing protein n=1 Tax=Armillaria tabescens TaxID=1929756 RepID=A0AA39N8M0_ARMTA|nr:uncharacterized protein EV420DRAFT_1267286 [Desarmillaria tabescens]KAK0461034.1 hypothetical protein EV420DRAFT_1267286 [Desarmillaria tabescens]
MSRSLFFVYCPDKTEDGTFERRLSVRSNHLEDAGKAYLRGIHSRWDGLITPESLTSETKKMVGSAFICEAKDIDEVKEKVKADVYYTAGVWDPEKIVILPFVGATPVP